MDESMINEALGLTGENTNTADTENTAATDTTHEDENAQVSDTSEKSEGSPENTQEPPHEQSAEENARYAAARRSAEAERDRAIAAEKVRAAHEVDSLIESMGMINPYTGQPIRNRAEYDEYNKSRVGEAKKTFMEQSGMSESQYRQMVNSLPEVQEAQRAKAESERMASEYRTMRARARLESQISEVSKLDPTIKSMDDLVKMENYDTFYELVKKGNSFTDAYKLANYDKLIERSAAAEKQRNLNSAAGKQHFIPNASSGGAGLEEVPADTKAYYKLMFPEMNDEQIAKEYTKYKKNK